MTTPLNERLNVVAPVILDVASGVSRLHLRIAETLTAVNPLLRRRNRYYLRANPPDLPVPPAALLMRVAGSPNVRWFLEGGRLALTSITDALDRQGVAAGNLDTVLDFGCGCGRVVRHWPGVSGATMSGVDYNPELIGWCRKNLPFGAFQVNQLAPPLAFGDASFDLVYALSVFTHLPEALQNAWLDELARVLRPGGHLLLTLHGEHYRPELTDAERAVFDADDLVVRHAIVAGTNRCTTFHPPAYVQQQMQRGLTLVEHLPEGAAGNPFQDLVLFHKDYVRL